MGRVVANDAPIKTIARTPHSRNPGFDVSQRFVGGIEGLMLLRLQAKKCLRQPAGEVGLPSKTKASPKDINAQAIFAAIWHEFVMCKFMTQAGNKCKAECTELDRCDTE